VFTPPGGHLVSARVNGMSRNDAQQRADEIRAFGKELARLQADGVLTLSPAQIKAMDDAHRDLLGGFAQEFDIDRDLRARQLSLGMRIASFLGALALAASVFFLFHQFWGLFPVVAQVAILLVAALGAFLATCWIQRRDGSAYFTKLAAMVAFACFVLNIYLLGQIFNITPSDQALIPWAAFALLLAYRCDQRLLLIAAILCIVAFIAARTGTACGMYWLDFGERPENFFPAAIVLWFIPRLVAQDRFAGFAAVYRVSALLCVFLPSLVLGNWGQASYLLLDKDLVEGAYQLLGFLGSALALWFGIRRNHGEVVNCALVFFVVFLYTKFFDWWWEIMPKYLFFLVLGLTAVLFLLILRRLRRSESAPVAEHSS